MKTRSAVIIAAAAIGLSACNAGVREAPVAPAAQAGEVAGVRDGHTTMASGQTLRIALPSNATTSYRWTLAQTDADLLAPGSPFGEEITDPHPPGMVGVGGATVWTFQAVRPGTAILTFTYGRSWEPNAPPGGTATYTITVR